MTPRWTEASPQVCGADEWTSSHITEPDALHRMSVDTVSSWMTDHPQERTAIHEQRANQGRTSSSTPAHRSTPSASTNAYYDSRIEAYEECTLQSYSGPMTRFMRRRRGTRGTGRHPGSWGAIFVVEHQHQGHVETRSPRLMQGSRQRVPT